MSPEISDWVKSAINEVGSKSYELDPTAAKNVQDEARNIYVEGDVIEKGASDVRPY